MAAWRHGGVCWQQTFRRCASVKSEYASSAWHSGVSSTRATNAAGTSATCLPPLGGAISSTRVSINGARVDISTMGNRVSKSLVALLTRHGEQRVHGDASAGARRRRGAPSRERASYRRVRCVSAACAIARTYRLSLFVALLR